jgi:hypothetical protein
MRTAAATTHMQGKPTWYNVTELASNMSMCVCARMRKVDRLDEIGDAPLKEKKDEVTFRPTAFNGFLLSLLLLQFLRGC